MLFRSPALSRTQIVFSYSGDLWSVPREGGEARRLTVSPGNESYPVFSPDGSQIAFTGEYDGNADVYVMPAGGGVPQRLTWHPKEDGAVGWTPDGKRILFCSTRDMPYDGARLFTMPATGGFPEPLALPIAFEASYSPDGSHLAYVPLFQWQKAWKRYRGGQTLKIWIADLSNSSVVAIPRQNSNDFNPLWVGDRIYFLSDRNGPVTLFWYDLRTKEVRQAIENRGLDFKSASAGPGAIVYEQFGALHLYDLKTGQSHPVEIHLAGDLPEVRPHYVDVSKRLRAASLSPTGARAVFEARGEILTVPADKGDVRNLTNTTTAAERAPVWSPDGQSIAYFSDESGEYMLHIRGQEGMGEVKKIPLGAKPDFYYRLGWSPNSKKIVFNDCHARIFYVDVDTKKVVQVDSDYYETGPQFMANWSPDSKWLTYAKDLKSQMGAIYLYSLATGKSTQVTDGMSDARSPAFDREGKYLYFIASTDAGPSMQPDLEGFSHPVSYSAYVMVLAADQPSPLAPESDDEKKKDDSKKDDAKKDPPDVKIDFDNIGQRILALPLPAKRYAGLLTGKPGFVYAAETSAPQAGGDPPMTIWRLDVAKRKVDTAGSGVKSFDISFNGEKMLYHKDDSWKIANATDGGDEKTLRTQDLEVRVDPPAEWKQMYHEAWRIERDFFYDPHYHGLDLKTAEERYSVYLDGLGSREDLNYLFNEMLGNLTVGHMFIRGGE
jgi:tricorn protease